MDDAQLEARLRRTAWVQLAIGIALIPIVYWIMVELLLPRFWIEDDKAVPEAAPEVVSQLEIPRLQFSRLIAQAEHARGKGVLVEEVHIEQAHIEDAKGNV